MLFWYFLDLEGCSTYIMMFFFSGKLTHVLKEEDTKIIKGIPQIYIENRNIKQQMVTG